MQKITVSNLMNIGANEPHIIDKDCLSIHIHGNTTIITTTNGQLKGFDLLTRKPIFQLQLPSEFKGNTTSKISVAQLGNLLAISSHNKNALWIVDIKEGSQTIQKFDCHVRPITSLISFANCFITGSEDMTIRVWKLPHVKGTKFVKSPLALHGHQNSITCLNSYDAFLLSGSKDRTLRCWFEEKLWTSFCFDDHIAQILVCPASEQLIVFTRNSKAHFFDIMTVASKKIQIRGTLDFSWSFDQKICATQINQSFFAYGSGSVLGFVEVNLIKFLHEEKRQSDGHGNLEELSFRGNSLFSGYENMGVSLINL